jgi:hypothetical protein
VKIILGLAAILAAGSTSMLDDGWPPIQYTADNTATVLFATDVNASCGANPKGGILEACQSGPRITLPNPCNGKFQHETFARLTCHELGHLNGWPGNHPRP